MLDPEGFEVLGSDLGGRPVFEGEDAAARRGSGGDGQVAGRLLGVDEGPGATGHDDDLGVDDLEVGVHRR